MNRYILELTEHGLLNSELWNKMKKWFLGSFLLPKITRPDLTKLPKLPKGIVYQQWRINKYEEHLEEQQNIWENSQ